MLSDVTHVLRECGIHSDGTLPFDGIALGLLQPRLQTSQLYTKNNTTLTPSISGRPITYFVVVAQDLIVLLLERKIEGVKFKMVGILCVYLF